MKVVIIFVYIILYNLFNFKIMVQKMFLIVDEN